MQVPAVWVRVEEESGFSLYQGIEGGCVVYAHKTRWSPPPPFSRETEELKDAGLKPSSKAYELYLCVKSRMAE